jgi:hypothetical protein
MTMLRFYAIDEDGIEIRTAHLMRVNPFGAEHDKKNRPIRKGTFARYRRGVPNPFICARFSLQAADYYSGCPVTRDRIQWIHDNTTGCWSIYSYTTKAARRMGSSNDLWWFTFGFQDRADAAKYKMVWE